jgi:MFS family permease
VPTSSASRPAIAATLPPPARPGARGVSLALVLGAQFMIILDLAVVNIALPQIGHGLRFSAASLSWVLNAYSLTFGGLLLFGGRLGDLLGRRKVFMAGLAIFTLASLAGSVATSAPALVAARAAQGAGGAVASPAVLALIVSSFPEGRERTRALGVFTAVVMGGASLGLVLGGLITAWASWRWVLFINVPIGAGVILAAPRFLPETARQSGRLDVTGALSSTAGMSALVYAFIRAATNGWADRGTVAAFAAAAALLAGFLVAEARSAHPVAPLRLFANRGRSASYLIRLLVAAGLFGMFFFLTQFLQEVLGFSPLRAGIAFLPMTVTLFGTSRLAPRLAGRFPPKPLMVAGLLPVVPGHHLRPGHPRANAGARRRAGGHARAADQHLAARRTPGGLRCRSQHGRRGAAGGRGARAGHPGHRLRQRCPRGGRAGSAHLGRAPGGRCRTGRAPGHHPGHGQLVHDGMRVRRGRAAASPAGAAAAPPAHRGSLS